jgi:hypothetical protein
MKTSALAVLVLILGTPLSAQERTAIEPDQVVGTVLGRPITAADIELTQPIDASVKFDARDKERWALMGRIANAFGKPISDRFVEGRKIEVSASEILAFNKRAKERNEQQLRDDTAELAKVKEKLGAADLGDDERAKLQKELRNLGSRIKALETSIERGLNIEIAQMILLPRKIERELHRVYGGRVIFQQFGPEALDARRRLYEEAEKKGDLTFTDPGVRHMFYYYYNMRHSFVDEELLKKAWR